MKYTLDGFSQEEAIKLGLDSTDLRLLRYFIDFKDSGAMAKEIINDDIYYWLKYEAVLEQLPILKVTKRTIMKRFQTMANKKVLRSYTKRKEGTYSFYAVGEKYNLLVSSNITGLDKGVLSKAQGVRSKVQGYSSKSIGVCFQKDKGVLSKEEQNINLLKDSSIKNITLLEDKKEQSSTSSDSILGIKKVIYLALKEVSPQDIAYKTFFEPTEVIEVEDKVIIRAPETVYGIMPRKYMDLIKQVVDKPIELVEMEV